MLVCCFCASIANAATVNISDFSGSDGVLTYGEFISAQNAAGNYGTIKFNETLTTNQNLAITKKGITVIGIDSPTGKRVFKKTHANYTTTTPTFWNSMNLVTEPFKIDPQAPSSSIFRIATDDVTIKNLYLTASKWPLLKANVSSTDGEGTRVATGVEMGISITSGKTLTIDDVKIDRVNVAINYNRDLLPHGLTLKNSIVTGGRGIINSAESLAQAPDDTALESRMIIDNNRFLAYQQLNKNFISARGLTFDYGNYVHTSDPFAGPGPINFLNSEITNNIFDAYSTFAIDFNRAKNITIGGTPIRNSKGIIVKQKRNIIKIGRYRTNYINIIHFEAKSSNINIIENKLTIKKVGDKVVTNSSHIWAGFGSKTKGATSKVLAKRNEYMGFPSGHLVGVNIVDWRFQDEKVNLWGGDPSAYVRTIDISESAAGHKLWGTKANNDFWTSGNKFSKFKYGWN